MKIKRILAETEFMEVADFIFEVNNELSCSSMFCSNHLDVILAEIKDCSENKLIAVCCDDDKIYGVCWFYYDPERNNADVNLMIPSENHSKYAEIAEPMLKALRAELPDDAKLTFYFPKQNTSCADFLRSHNATQNINEYGLLLHRDSVGSLADTSKVELLMPEDYAQMAALHDEISPDIYISGKNIIESIGKNRTVFVIKENGVINAFAVMEKKSETMSCAEIIAVRDGFRHAGRGYTVLSYLIKQAFADEKTEAIDLIVDCDNENAMKLYFSLGFKVQYENNSFTLE